MNQSELAQSPYHYHHQMAYQHLLKAQDHLKVARQDSIQKTGLVPEWLLRFEKDLQIALETVPELSQAQDLNLTPAQKKEP